MSMKRCELRIKEIPASKKRARCGFTLIEAVIVIVVMGLAAVGLSTVIYQALQDTNKPEVISTAITLAEKEAERVMRLDFSAVVNENRDTPQSYSGNFANYSWQVRIDSIDVVQSNLVSVLGSDPTMASYKVVEVRVHHSAIGYSSIKLLKALH